MIKHKIQRLKKYKYNKPIHPDPFQLSVTTSFKAHLQDDISKFF